MEHEIIPALIRAFTCKASALGYCVAEKKGQDTPSPCLVVSHGGREVCHIQQSGAMCFVCDKALEQEGQELYDLFRTIKQAYDQYAGAEPLNMEGLTDFRRLAEFGNCLLAARIGSDGEMKYVTWQYDRDRTGVTTGHYYETDGEGARQDFAIRSGLVQGCRIFGKEETGVLYHACMVCIQADGDMTFEGEKKLREVMGKLEENLPELESGGQVLGNARKVGNEPIQETVGGAGLFWEGEEYEQE